MALITVNNLSLGYDQQSILDGLNFTVNEGDYLCIVGENGSGKSTLMKTLLGLNEPLGGEIIMGDGLKKNEIGYLPQQTQVQKDFPASVKEIVLSGCQGHQGLRPFYSAEDKRIANENMQRMDIISLENRCYRELSGGQQQRVLLARALCATRRVLLLDEPVSGLDPVVTAQMYELIAGINHGCGDNCHKEHKYILGHGHYGKTTIIMISHDVDAAVKYASHILHIGSEVFFGTKEEYLNSETGKEFIAAVEGEGVKYAR